MDVIDIFDHGVYLGPDRDCLVMDDRRWSYRQTQRVTMQVASALVRDGIASGSRIAVLSDNDPMAFMCVLGLFRAHMVWVPLNPRNSNENQLATLRSFGCELLIYQRRFQPVADRAREQVETLQTLVCLDANDAGAHTVDEWLRGVAATFSIEPVDRDEVVALFATGGTTGLPKGVMQTHLFYETYVGALMNAMPATTPPQYLAAAPMTHAAGLFTLPVFARGGTVFILPAAKPLMIAEAVQKHRITDVILPPTVVYGMLAEPTIRDYDFGSMRYFWYGTAPMAPDKVREAIQVFGNCMVSGWGQSEGIPFTFLRADDLVRDGEIVSERRLASCGRMYPFTKVAVMDPHGKLLEANQTGELVVRSTSLMKGYYQDPEATAEAGRHGWHHTGDIGFFDDEGYFYIVDRAKDLIISGGFNIFPSEIERVIFTHPAVEDCAVIGVPDEKWGERIMAIVQLKAGADATGEEMMAYCRDRLGSMKAPRSIEFRAELPRSAVGKTLKRALRDEFWAGRSRLV